MPTADRGLRVSGLAAQAGSFILGPVSLTIPPDRVLVVLGPSGAGKTVLLEKREDKAIVGGLVTQLGDLVFDGSVRSQLALLREQLLAE